MKVTGKELKDMRARVADGTADDNDHRLVALYGEGDDHSDGEQLAVTGTAEAEVVRPRKSTRSRA